MRTVTSLYEKTFLHVYYSSYFTAGNIKKTKEALTIDHAGSVLDMATVTFLACILISLFLWFSINHWHSCNSRPLVCKRSDRKLGLTSSPASELQSTRPSLSAEQARLARSVTFLSSWSSDTDLDTRLATEDC